ncbi:hypothetical protein [Bradyrhizobium sp. CSS354]|uniref:hypothetical protein n=1 Tax=Bradyrhizobium sp. CSS354 TaxID=2699172 RepID=UPI0023B04592|nr:hypothetical protein [Bradyrhizobium sp. CSS354]MDE5465393.1 hypothetical protein [Bradyrhizobium sp. CSS354]
MTPQQFQALYPPLIGWIHQTLQAHSNEVRIVSSLGFPRLSQYFSRNLLSSTKVAVVERVPMPPLSSLGLSQFAEFENGDYDGITYLDTFFVKRRSASSERLHFHELVHVVQWRLLGPERFLATYADGLEKHGYRQSPLESMAYTAEEVFCQSNENFNAEKLVADELDRMSGGV